MSKAKWLLLLTIVATSACGYDGNYRYSCQDPANWKNEECNPPLCEVDGNCTETLLGFNPNKTTTIPVEETVAP